VTKSLAADLQHGLSRAEARARLERLGRNELEPEEPVPTWRRVAVQLRDPLTVLLLVAAALSLVVWYLEAGGGWPYEALTVMAVVIVNATLAVIQEGRAERALAHLAQLAPPTALVLREGVPEPVVAAEVVPGDLLLLEEGQAVPADARVVQTTGLRTAEAALTGESTPITKELSLLPADTGLADRANMVFAGSSVVSGRGRAIVTATGMRTELGRVAGLLQTTAQEKTPLQRELDRVGRLLGKAVLLIAAVVTVTLLWAEGAHTMSVLLEGLLVGVSLAVAAVPEGLTAVTTVVLALGMERMARRQAVVRRLTAVEALGSATTICSDKTGTLTRNEMMVRAALLPSGRVDFSGHGYSLEGEVSRDGQPLDPATTEELHRLLRAGVLANNAVLVREGENFAVRGDPTEGALKIAAFKAGLDEARIAGRFPRLGEVPFSSERKLMSTAHADTEKERRVLVSKGAPDLLLGRCTHERHGEEEVALAAARRAEILARIEGLAAQALRPLGLAYRVVEVEEAPSAWAAEHERDLVWLGAVGMIDPPRPEAMRAVAAARNAGIRTLMITGDHPKTAAAIAAELELAPAEGEVLTGRDLDALDSPGLRAAVTRASIYARVSPEHKLRIVGALQAEGQVVAMTGDGVNDAPALKKADIGVAMGVSGTDVSKGAADMVLMDDNYATIVAAVEEGRAIYENIQRFLRYLLSSNAGEVLVMFLGVVLAGLLGLRLPGDGALVVPLLPAMILWMNLLTDALPALALGLDPPDPDVMLRPPRDPRRAAITPRMWGDIAGIGAVMAVGTLLMVDWALPGGLMQGSGTPARAQTLAFTTLVLFQLWNVFAARSDVRSALLGLGTNLWLIGAVALSLLLQALVVYWPPLQRAFQTVSLSLHEWLLCTAVASTVLWLGEVRKLVRRRFGL
jgi:Ca2+-transporting ATPase